MSDPFAGVASPVMQAQSSSDPFAGVASPVMQPEKPGLIDRIGNDYAARKQDVQNFSQYNPDGSLGTLSQLNALGNAAGFTLGDITKEAVKSLIPTPHTPEWAQAIGSTVSQAASHLVPGIQTPQWAQDAASSRVGHALGTGANLAAIPAAVSGVDSLYSAGQDAFNAKNLAGIQDVVLPKQTPSEIANTALQRTTSGGVLNKQVYTPTSQEADMIQAASDAGVKPNAPLENNIQIVNAAKNAEAQKLKSTLDNLNVPIPPATLNQAGTQLAQKIAANPLVDENSPTVRKILETAQTAIDNNPKTAAGVLQARKDFDNAITQFQPSALDTDAPATAFRYTSKQVRQAMNGVIGDAVPTVEVRASLAKQSHLYDAIDNMAGKLPQQPDGRFARFFATTGGKALKYSAAATGATAAGRAALRAIPSGETENYYGGDSQ